MVAEIQEQTSYLAPCKAKQSDECRKPSHEWRFSPQFWLFSENMAVHVYMRPIHGKYFDLIADFVYLLPGVTPCLSCMHLPIHIDQPHARVYDDAVIQAAIAGSAHALPGAEVRYWMGDGYTLIEQSYDTRDVYLCSLEVDASLGVTIPIRCCLHDLYGFYQLEGRLAIAEEGRVDALRIRAGQYLLSYLPPARYRCRFRQGRHRILYVVLKGKVLFREPSPELASGHTPMEALKRRLDHVAYSSALPMNGAVAATIQHFLRSPGRTYLRRYAAIQALAMSLLFQAIDDLELHHQGQGGARELAARMRRYIDEAVAGGDSVDTEQVAWRFKVSNSYARAIFKAHVGRGIGAYISAAKLAQAKYMLDGGYTPAQAARYVCWTYSHFSKAFKGEYGMSPREYPSADSGKPCKITPPAP